MPKYTYSNYTKNYFKVIDTENKAYILGFLFADGTVYKDTNKIKIKLNYRDISILNTIKNCIGLENPIKHRRYKTSTKHGFSEGFITNSATLVFTNKQIKTSLIKHGCIPNKSLILEPPKEIPKNLIPHFIRGYVDGDGSFFTITEHNKTTEKTYIRYGFEVLGTKNMLKYIATHLPGKYEIKKCNKGEVYYIRSAKSNTVYEVGNYLYKNSNIYLPRKKKKFDSMKMELLQIKNKTRKVKCKQTGKVFNSIKEAADTTLLPYNTVFYRIRNNLELSQFKYID